MNKFNGPKIDMTSHASANYDETPDVNVEQGGSFFGSIGKSISHAASSIGHGIEHTADKVGHTIVRTANKSGKELGKDAVALGDQIKKTGIQKLGNDIANKSYNFIKDNGTKFIESAEEYAPEAAAVAEEDAPLLLLAAGMKKPKRSRQTSPKEKNRLGGGLRGALARGRGGGQRRCGPHAVPADVGVRHPHLLAEARGAQSDVLPPFARAEHSQRLGGPRGAAGVDAGYDD
jgi:hypothetical protein